MKTQTIPAEDIAAFIRTKGITRCPTACAARTIGAAVPMADQQALADRYARQEITRTTKRIRF